MPIRRGIYAIVNTTTHRSYVGQSSNIAQRWGEHRRRLRAGIHPNAGLQIEWVECGEAAFRFDLLEVVDGDEVARRRREAAWVINILNSGGATYNGWAPDDRREREGWARHLAVESRNSV